VICVEILAPPLSIAIVSGECQHLCANSLPLFSLTRAWVVHIENHYLFTLLMERIGEIATDSVEIYEDNKIFYCCVPQQMLSSWSQCRQYNHNGLFPTFNYNAGWVSSIIDRAAARNSLDFDASDRLASVILSDRRRLRGGARYRLSRLPAVKST